jgi:hypothetical protein
MKFWDLVIITLAFIFTGYSALRIYTGQQNTGRVLIQGLDQQWVFPQDSEETIVVPGPLGNTIVKIHQHQAWVESSPCTNQTCVAAGRIQRQGLWVACLPNQVFLMIEGSNDSKDTPDAAAW